MCIMHCRKYYLHDTTEIFTFINAAETSNCIIATEAVTCVIATKRSTNVIVAEKTTNIIAIEPENLRNRNTLAPAKML